MPAPTVIFESSAATSGTGAISVSRPAAGVGQAGDLELLFVETANQAVTTPSGFNILSGSPVGVGTAAATTASRLSIFYRFNTGETAAISVADAGDHTLATLVTLRNVDPSSPFQAITTYSNATAGTSFSQTGLDVATDIFSLAFAVVADQIDSTSSQGITPTLTFATALSPTWTAKSYRSTSGNGGGITYRRAQIDDPAANHITGLTITSTGSIIPCAICFYVRGLRGGPALASCRSYVDERHSASGSDGPTTDVASAVAATALTAGTGTISVPRVAGIKTGDVEFLIAEYPSGDLTVPNGWQHAPGSPVANNNASATLATVLAVLWRVSDGDTTNVSLTAPTDHILAMHAYATGVDEASPFMTGVGGTCTRSGTISDSKYVEVNFWNDGGPYYTVEPPYGADLLSFCLTANSLDTTTAGQVGFNLSASKSDFSPFYNSTNVLGSSLQSSTGNGGGIGLRVDSFVTQDYDSDQTYRRIFFNSATINRDSSTVIGYAAMSFILRGKKAKGASFSDMVAFSSEATVSVTKTSVGGVVDTCPYVYSSSGEHYSTGALSVPSPSYKHDGTTITDNSEYNGKLELLFVETSGLEAVATPSGWTEISNSPVFPENGATRLTAFWRIHPDNSSASVSLADPGTRISAVRILVAGAEASEPILTTTFDSVFGGPDSQNLFSRNGGNGYNATDWPEYGDVILQMPMNLVIGAASCGRGKSFYFWGDEYEDPYGQSETAGPSTSLDTWAPLDVGEQPWNGTYLALFHGKRFLNSTTTGNLDPARLTRVELPRMGFFGYNEDYAGIWVVISSQFLAPAKYGQALLPMANSVMAAAHTTNANNCPVLFAYGPKAEGTGSVTVYPPNTKPDGSTVGSISEYNGKLEFLIVETANQSFTVTGTGWTQVANSPSVGPVTTAGGTNTTAVFVYYRVHPDDSSENVILSDPGDHILAMRIMFANTKTDTPILTTAKDNVDTWDNRIMPTGSISSEAGFFSALGIMSWSNDTETRAFEKKWYRDDVLGDMYNDEWDVMQSQGYQYGVETWGLLQTSDLMSFEYGTTQGNGGGFHLYFGKHPRSTTPTGPVKFPGMGSYQEARYSAAIWIAFESAAALIVKEGTATITLIHSVLGEGGRMRAGEALINLAHLVNGLASKMSTVQSVLGLNAQAVPLVRKASSGQASAAVALAISATGDVFIFPGQGGEAALLLESSIAASVSKGLLQAVSEEFASATDAAGRKDAFAEILEGHTSSAILSGGKSVTSGIAFSLDSLLSAMSRKATGGAFSDQLDSDIFFIVSKASAREFLAALSSSVWSQGRLVTTFEYGDMVVVDLRAAIPALDHSCVRRTDVLQSRRNLEAELSAMRGLPESDARRRALDVLGAGPRILGTEIVCVREVFNEGE